MAPVAEAGSHLQGESDCVSTEQSEKSDRVHQRHKNPNPLSRPRELVVVCGPMRSNVNLSRIVRACGCCGVTKVYCAGSGRVIEKIARDGKNRVEISTHRSLLPLLKTLRSDGYQLVALEQASNSNSLYTYGFSRRTALIVGNERNGLSDEVLHVVDEVVEIPVYGLPFSHNAATATAITIYEYCRQFPQG